MIAIIAVQLAVNGTIMNEAVTQKLKSIARLREPELALVPHAADGPDPRLVELARLLARRAAQEWYNQIAEERRSKRS